MFHEVEVRRRRQRSRHKSHGRNSKRANTMRGRHPPREGIMSPKMHFCDISLATKVLRRLASAHVVLSNEVAAMKLDATFRKGDLCRQKRVFAT
jgi:hypothetical protein